MADFKGNGNKFSHKAQKKRKNFVVKLEEESGEQYAKVCSLEGGMYLTVTLANTGENARAIMRGKHHKRAWFKKGETIIVSGTGANIEVKGKVSKEDESKANIIFNKIENNGSNELLFSNNNNYSSDEENEEQSDDEFVSDNDEDDVKDESTNDSFENENNKEATINKIKQKIKKSKDKKQTYEKLPPPQPKRIFDLNDFDNDKDFLIDDI